MPRLTTCMLTACALISLVPAQAIAQPQHRATAPSGQLSVLREGTPVTLITTTDLNSKVNRTGDRFNLEVAEDVILGGQVVIPRGASAVGEVTRVVKKGAFGKSGKIDTRLLYVMAAGQQIRLSGQSGDRGKSGTAGTVGAAIAVGVFSFLVTGTSANIPPGTRMAGYIGSDLPVMLHHPAPAPLLIAQPSTAAVPAATPATLVAVPR